MKISSIEIKNFKSIKQLVISDFSDFNVLIGKNNSGKTNALSAIDTFFKLITNDRKYFSFYDENDERKELNFFNRNTDYPIEITIDFLLDASNYKKFIAVNGIKTFLLNKKFEKDVKNILSVTLNINYNLKKYNIINKVIFKHGEESTTIFELDSLSEEELYQKFKMIKGLQLASEHFGMDDSTWNQRRRNQPGFNLLDSIPKNEFVDDKVIELLNEYNPTGNSPAVIKSHIANKTYEIEQQILVKKTTKLGEDEIDLKNILIEILDIIFKSKMHYIADMRDSIDKEDANKLFKLDTTRENKKVFKNIERKLKELFNVDIEVFKNKEDAPAEIDLNDFLVKVNGSGIRQAMRIVLDYLFIKPSFLLIEEPEIYLHPEFESKLTYFLKEISNDCQVFITTHSTNFLDRACEQNIYLVTKNNKKETEISLLGKEEAEIYIPKELGLKLSSIFLYDKLIFVEGDSDIDVFKEFASKLGYNTNHSNIGFISMGGCRNLKHFASETTINFLTKKQVELFFILDRDEKDKSEIEKLEQTLGKSNVFINILKKRELENYFISPVLLSKYIESCISKKIQVDTIEQTIIENANKLKTFVIDKRVAKIIKENSFLDFGEFFEKPQEESIGIKLAEKTKKFINKLNNQISDLKLIYSKEEEIIEQEWETKMLDLVPGDYLLNSVFKALKADIKFKKSRDCIKIASIMNEDDITDEIKTILKRICEKS